MADIKFSQLPNLGNVTAATIVPVVSSGVNYSVTGANLQAFVNNSTGNITGGNIIATTAVIGNGSQLTNLPAANIVGTVANATYATSAGTATTATSATSATSATTAGTVTTAAQANITSVGTLTSLTVSGNIVGGNLTTAGNVQGTYIKGDGSLLTGLPATYANANVVSLMASFGSNTITTTGNITGGNVIATKLYGDGSALTGITANAVLQGTMSGNIAGNGYSITNLAVLTTTGNITGGNVVASGLVQGTTLKGEGANITGIVTSIQAGTGISVSAATGVVTITNTGSTSGNANLIVNSNGYNYANVGATDGRVLIVGGNTALGSQILPSAANLIHIRNTAGNSSITLDSGGNINFTIPSGSKMQMGSSGAEIRGNGYAEFSTLSIGSNGIDSYGPLRVTPVSGSLTSAIRSTLTTKTGTSSGVAGDMIWDSNYIYVCTAANTWKRVALSSF